MRGETASFYVRKGSLVGRDHAGACTSLNAHVADRHAPLHGERTDRLACILDRVAGSAIGPDLPNDAENKIFRRDSFRQGALNIDEHGLGLALGQALSRQNMLDLGSTHAKGQRAESTVGAGMTVAAHDRHAGLSQAQLRPNNVDDALLG